MPHAWIQMPLQMLIIHFVNDMKHLIHEHTKADEIGPFERIEVVDAMIIQLP